DGHSRLANFQGSGQTIREMVAHEVHRPSFARPRRCSQRHPRRRCESPTTAYAHREPFVAIDAIHALVIDLDALPAQKHVQASIAETRSLGCEPPQTCDELRRWRPFRFVTVRCPRHTERATRPPLAHAECDFQIRDLTPSRRGLHHFFASTAFSAWLSSACSATIFFSRAFSSSSCRRRFASLTSIPPNFARHR